MNKELNLFRILGYYKVVDILLLIDSRGSVRFNYVKHLFSITSRGLQKKFYLLTDHNIIKKEVYYVPKMKNVKGYDVYVLTPYGKKLVKDIKKIIVK